MKRTIISGFFLILLIVAFLACNKKEKIVLPSVETASVDEIYNTMARVGGDVTKDGGAEVTERGVFLGTSTSPENGGQKLQEGKGLGIFHDSIKGLSPGTKYYVKAYAINLKGTSYGAETFFTTQISLPTVTTTQVTGITANSAIIGGQILNDGGFKITASGLYWGIYSNPRTTGTKIEIDNTKGTFSQTLTNLNRANTYYVVAFATNIKGTSYGNEISFSTAPQFATVTTSAIINIATFSATVGGNVASDGGGNITETGVYWGISAGTETTGTKLPIGNSIGKYSSTLNNLNPGTTYFIKAYAMNSLGISYGDEISFLTLGEIPVITFLKFTNLTPTSVTLKAVVNSNNLSTTVSFDYGTTNAYGSSLIPSHGPFTGSADTFSVTLSGLSPKTTYHYRVNGVNQLGTFNSTDSTFTTVITGMTGTVKDYEGNAYQTIGIGYQEWMTQNLRSTKYNDGTSIPYVPVDTTWTKLSSPGYCWYNNDQAGYSNTYGGLYNWFTINTNKLCPSGWHVPSDDDFTSLAIYLNNESAAGGLLKESGTSHWNDPNTGASNKYGFAALPGGKRMDNGSFIYQGEECNFWSTNSYSSRYGTNFYLLYNFSSKFQSYQNKKYGATVRCLKN